MEIVKKEISLNVGQPNNFEMLCAMQGDNKAYEITATLYDVNKLYTITTDNIKLKGVTPDGRSIYIGLEEHTDHTITFLLTESMTAIDGLVKLVIVLTDSSEQLTTFPFVIKVINSPGNPCADDFKSVSALVEEAQKWALLSKSYAVGTEGVARENDATDNSKYYCEQAKSYSESSKEYSDEIKELIESGEIGNGRILYYDTYDAFKADLDAGNIENETLICIKENVVIEDEYNTDDDTSETDLTTPFPANTLACIGDKNYILYSLDQGNTFVQESEYSGIDYGGRIPCYHMAKIDNVYYILGGNTLYKSSSLKNFEEIYTFNKDNYRFLYGCNNMLFTGGYNNELYYSKDFGNTWTLANIYASTKERVSHSSYTAPTITPEYTINNMIFKNNIYLLGGDFGHCYYSYNGTDWTEISESLTSEHSYFVYYNAVKSKFILVGLPTIFYKEDTNEAHNIVIYESADGINWTHICNTTFDDTALYRYPIFPEYLYVNDLHIIYNRRFIAYFSEDTTTQQIIDYEAGATNMLSNIFPYKNYYLAVSYYGKLYKSTNGVNWEELYSNSSLRLNRPLLAINENPDILI